jgi:hypothetical protein
MNLIQWAIKWGVSIEAIDDLKRDFGLINTDVFTDETARSEAAIQALIRLEASKKGARLWRNNVGAYDARFPPSPGTRWGLCNETKGLNKLLKSSDLIGLRPVLITNQHVGQVIGQFLAREVKAEGWGWCGNEHEIAQLAFLQLITALGGDAAFATNEGTL